MAWNFQRGDFVPVSFQATTGALTRIDIQSHTIDATSLTFDVTHTGHEGVKARIGGTEDAKGTVNGSFDLDAPPYGNAPYVRNGVSGIALFYVAAAGLNRFFQIPCIIPKLHFETAHDNYVKWSFDVEMNRIAGRPAYPAL